MDVPVQLDGRCCAGEPVSFQRTPLLCSPAILSWQAPFLRSLLFYFQTQNCLQLPLLKPRQLYLSKSAFELRNVFCGVWLIQKSNSQRDYSLKPKYVFLHIVHQLASITIVKPSIPLCLQDVWAFWVGCKTSTISIYLHRHQIKWQIKSNIDELQH